MEDFNLESEEIQERNGNYIKYKDFITLKAWKDAREMKLFFYNQIIPLLPVEEKYNLDKQIRTAAISATANIAEGYGRYYFKEGIQFFRISRGSIYELKDHLISCFDLNYISNDLFKKGLEYIEKSKISINGYINYIKRKTV